MLKHQQKRVELKLGDHFTVKNTHLRRRPTQLWNTINHSTEIGSVEVAYLI